MKILYDHQAFRTGRFSGIPRYFTELVLQYNKTDGVTPILPKFWTINQDYRNLNICKPNIIWNIRDKVTELSQKYLNQNPSRLMDGAENKTVKLLDNQDFDIFHPTRLEPYFLKHIGKKPYILTIHDLTYEKYPELFPLSTNVYKNTKAIVEKASRFIAISECTKRDFINYYSVDPTLIDVVYHVSLFEKYQIEVSNASKSETDSLYLLFVGERGMHKNFYHFAEVVAPIMLSNKIRLICAGGGIFRKDELIFMKSIGIDKITIQKTVNDSELINLYKNAIAYVFPSFNEGFGLPILEAFSCGCPVICSNTSCMPEVGGDAAVYFDPKDAESIKDAVMNVINNNELRNSMIAEGCKQLRKFSWTKCAEETMNVYNKVISE